MMFTMYLFNLSSQKRELKMRQANVILESKDFYGHGFYRQYHWR